MNDIYMTNDFSFISLRKNDDLRYKFSNDYKIHVINGNQYQSTLLFLIRTEQMQLFLNDYKMLQQNLVIGKKSKISNLRLFLDQHLLLWIKGRIIDRTKRNTSTTQHY